MVAGVICRAILNSEPDPSETEREDRPDRDAAGVICRVALRVDSNAYGIEVCEVPEGNSGVICKAKLPNELNARESDLWEA